MQQEGETRAITAATIDYTVVPRPADTLPGYQAASDAELTFLAIESIDRSPVGAALQQPRATDAGQTTLVIAVHGSGDSFDKHPGCFLAPMLAAKGYAFLGINTRQSRERVNTENFMDVRKDIEAAVFTARHLGYRRIVLLGHSLGNIQVLYYAANNWDADLCGVILLGAFANLPWKARNVIVQNEENWSQLQAAAEAAMRSGRVADPLPVKMRTTAGKEIVTTAQHFLTYRAAASAATDGTYWIKRVPRPLFLVRDEADSVIHRFEQNMLLAAATAPGSLVPGIECRTLANGKAAELKAHYFVDNQQPLADAIAEWLAARGLRAVLSSG